MKEHQHVSCPVGYQDCRCDAAQAKTESGKSAQELVTASFRIACFFIDQLCSQAQHRSGSHCK